MANLKLLGKMPEVPRTPPPIFTVERPNASEERLLNAARAFGLKAHEDEGSISRRSSHFTYSEAAFDVDLHRASGYLAFKDRTHWQVDHGADVGMPDEEAVARARDLLGVFNLLPAESRVQKVSRLAVAAAGPDRVIQDKRVIDIGVHIQPVLRGLPLDGPGGRINVYLDHERNLTCVEHFLRTPGPVYREVNALRTPEEALDEAGRAWSARGARDVEVREVRLCYFELGPNDDQTYLEPAYMILGTLVGREPRIRTGDIFVTPAAVNTVGSLAALIPPKPPAQTPRER